MNDPKTPHPATGCYVQRFVRFFSAMSGIVNSLDGVSKHLAQRAALGLCAGIGFLMLPLASHAYEPGHFRNICEVTLDQGGFGHDLRRKFGVTLPDSFAIFILDSLQSVSAQANKLSETTATNIRLAEKVELTSGSVPVFSEVVGGQRADKEANNSKAEACQCAVIRAGGNIWHNILIVMLGSAIGIPLVIVMLHFLNKQDNTNESNHP